MPANEQTWRDTKLLHLVFGISAVVMLLTTIWMMADDHNRPWKDFQRTFRNLDVQTTQWRAEEQQSADYEKHGRELEQALRKAQTFTAADRDHVVEFFTALKTDEDEVGKLAAENGRDFPSLYDKDAASSLRKRAPKNCAEQKDPAVPWPAGPRRRS